MILICNYLHITIGYIGRGSQVLDLAQTFQWFKSSDARLKTTHENKSSVRQ